MRAPDFWSGQGFGARFAVAALTPLGWAYGAATNWKHAAASPYRPRAKVICVGNLTAGGSGKTPIVLAIVRLLQSQQRRAVVLSRGYGGRIAGPIAANRSVHGARDVGDEPLLLAAHAPVIVARDRRRGAEFADAHNAEIIVMDDGHQNFALEKDLSIVVVDADRGFGNGHLIPAGPLRESVARGLARADAVVFLGAGTPALPGYSGPVLRARLVPDACKDYLGRKLLGFAGIGRPEKFFETLRTLNAEIVQTISFGDHHVFTAAEIARLNAKARSEGAMLVTTEKDFIRLTPEEREGICALSVRAEFDDPAAIQALLASVVAARASS